MFLIKRAEVFIVFKIFILKFLSSKKVNRYVPANNNIHATNNNVNKDACRRGQSECA